MAPRPKNHPPMDRTHYESRTVYRKKREVFTKIVEHLKPNYILMCPDHPNDLAVSFSEPHFPDVVGSSKESHSKSMGCSM